MRGRREGAARPPAHPAAAAANPVTECDGLSPGGLSPQPPHRAAGLVTDGDSEPLSEQDAEAQAHGICFKTGPPGRVGVELEWLVHDGRDPAVPVDRRRVSALLRMLDAPGALPGRGRLTIEPGGQVELSSAPSAGLSDCITGACRDLAALRQAAAPLGLSLKGQGLDPLRDPRRVLDEPRYTAMEEFFDRSGPWGRVMMCSTASVQVCLDAGEDGAGPAGFRWRWRLLHAIGPALVAAFANSPVRDGRPTGWKSTRQAVWSRLDPTRTRPPAHAEPSPWGPAGAPWSTDADPRGAWVAYALAARVMCVRRPGAHGWSAPAGLTFRDWLRGAGERPPTRDDLAYHLGTLFPPVRPRGHLEFRAIDAQPGDGWIVPVAVTTALLDDPVAAQDAMASAEMLWQGTGPACGPGGGAGRRWRAEDGDGDPWLRAARHGPADTGIAAVSRRCFEAAEAALGRLGAPEAIRAAVASFAERYVMPGRCPADDRLDEMRTTGGRWPAPRLPDTGLPATRAPQIPDTTLEDWP